MTDEIEQDPELEEDFDPIKLKEAIPLIPEEEEDIPESMDDEFLGEDDIGDDEEWADIAYKDED